MKFKNKFYGDFVELVFDDQIDTVYFKSDGDRYLKVELGDITDEDGVNEDNLDIVGLVPLDRTYFYENYTRVL